MLKYYLKQEPEKKQKIYYIILNEVSTYKKQILTSDKSL